MNKLPDGSGPIQVPITIVYLPADAPSKEVKHLRELPVTAANEDEARNMFDLLVPGGKIVGLNSGHERKLTKKPL